MYLLETKISFLCRPTVRKIRIKETASCGWRTTRKRRKKTWKTLASPEWGRGWNCSCYSCTYKQFVYAYVCTHGLVYMRICVCMYMHLSLSWLVDRRKGERRRRLLACALLRKHLWCLCPVEVAATFLAFFSTIARTKSLHGVAFTAAIPAFSLAFGAPKSKADEILPPTAVFTKRTRKLSTSDEKWGLHSLPWIAGEREGDNTVIFGNSNSKIRYKKLDDKQKGGKRRLFDLVSLSYFTARDVFFFLRDSFTGISRILGWWKFRERRSKIRNRRGKRKKRRKAQTCEARGDRHFAGLWRFVWRRQVRRTLLSTKVTILTSLCCRGRIFASS